MPTTTNYGVQYPAENEDPWYPNFVNMANGFDTVISSVEQVSRPRTTLIYSLYPAAQAVSSATGVSQGAAGVWTVLSSAPHGQAVCSFQLVGSGAQAVIAFNGLGYMEGTFGGGAGYIATRLVVRKSGTSSLVIPSNSAWFTIYNAAGQHQAFSWQTVASLGPGTYSGELQMRLTGVTASSRFIFVQGLATLTEASLGG